MAKLMIQQGAENMEYVRSLLRQKQPGFSAALELALVLAELEAELEPGELEPGELEPGELEPAADDR
jgi:hypothetical protein